MVVPEPFTVVATSLGLLSSLFSLIITSVRTLHEIREDFRQCEKKLVLLSNIVADVHRKQERIVSTWVAGTCHGEELYTYLFGREASEEIRSRTENVRDFAGIVLDVFNRGYDVETWRRRVGQAPRNTSWVLAPNETSAWKSWADHIFAGFKQGIRVEQLLEGPTAKRISFAMIHRADLERKVVDVQRAMQSLETYINDCEQRLPDICGKASKSTQEYLKSILQLERSHEDLSNFVSRKLGEVQATKKDLGIFLDADEDRTMLETLAARNRIHFECCISQTSEHGPRLRDGINTSFSWPRDKYSPGQSIGNSGIVSSPSLRFNSHNLHEIYKALEGWGDDDVMIFRKYSEHERYRALLGLWVMTCLLWNTPWITNLCECNLEQHQSFDGGPRFSLWPDPGCNQQHCPTPGFLASRLNQRQNGLEGLVRLGLVACETALCSPVTSVCVDGRTIFNYQIREYGEDLVLRAIWRTGVGASDLVLDVQDAMHGLQDAEILLLLCPVGVGPAISRYTEVCALLETDHSRLKDYYEIVREHKETQKDRLWSKSSQTRYDSLVQTVAAPRQSPDHFISYNSEKANANETHRSAVKADFEDSVTPMLRHRTGRVEPLPAQEWSLV